MLVSRTCTRQQGDDGRKDQRASTSVNLQALRDVYAFILLGDPGSGKSAAFKQEADALETLPISARDFVTFEQKPEKWRGKTIFIDGLDETRAGSSDGRTILDVIRQKLDQIGRPRFRLSCRAADWLGTSDRERLKSIVPNNEDPNVFQLDPLTEDDIEKILSANHGIADPTDFMLKAEQFRVSDLLKNPQTLAMLAKAVGTQNNWPTSRLQMYELACKQLLAEPNIEHQAAKRKTRPNDGKLLDAAGYLSCICLIADIQAITLSPTENDDALDLRAINNNYQLPLAECLETRLFQSIGNERFAPAHRTVAEHLAAQFIAKRLGSGLHISRVLALICGADGGVVTGLRGLHAWLAACTEIQRGRLIETDPVGVLLYGDAKGFPPSDKTKLLQALYCDPEQLSGVHWQDWGVQPFASLATPDMATEFERILRSPLRERADQAIADCVVDALCYGEVLPQLGTTLLQVVRDDSWWGVVRKQALRAYLKNYFDDAGTALNLLADIHSSQVKDREDNLLGILLERLYPEHVTPSAVLQYLHAPKTESYIGDYSMFWNHGLLAQTPDGRLEELLSAFSSKAGARDNSHFRDYWTPASGLLAKGLQTLGDAVNDATIFEWLGICLGEHNTAHLEDRDKKIVHEWFAERPERYTGVLRIALSKLPDSRHGIHDAQSRLLDAPQPKDIALWWLSQADIAQNQEVAKVFFLNAFWWDQSGKLYGGLSIEDLERWATQRPGFSDLLSQRLTCPLEHNEWRQRNAQRERKHAADRAARAAEFRAILPKLRDGTAFPQTLYTLAGTYFGHYHDVHGDTPIARLNGLLNDDEELVEASIETLKNSLLRTDLPSVEEVIKSDQQGKRYLLSLVILVGIELLFDRESEKFASLPDEVLLKSLVSRYTYGADNEPAWFEHLVKIRPDLVAQACIAYVRGCLKARKEYVHGIYFLAHDDAYAGVAKVAVPVLLKNFPRRAGLKQLSVLEYLLKAVIRYMPPQQLEALISAKLKLASLDVGQRVYWTAMGLITKSGAYEAKLRRYIGSSQIRVGHLGEFLHDRGDIFRFGREITPGSLALLTELLAPGCRPERPVGVHSVTPDMNRADLVRNFINQLAASGDELATEALERLIGLPVLRHWVEELRRAMNAQRIVRRDAGFVYPDHSQVSGTLFGDVPANATDVFAIVNEVLLDLGRELQSHDLNIYRQFWNEDAHGRLLEPKPEESCRDALAFLLRERLKRYSITCDAEARHVREKRSDMWCVYCSYGIPIEIKQDKHRDLWRGIMDQLIAKYSIDPRAHGHGIYVVLWFGGKQMPPPPSGAKPRTPEELMRRLNGQLTPEQRRHVSVCVLNCCKS